MFTIDKVVKVLRKAPKIQSRPVSRVTETNDFHSGPLFDRIQKEWKDKLPKRIQDFKYFSCAIDNLTGNEFLQSTVDILNNVNLKQMGNCIIFSLNRHYCAAMIMPNTNQVIFTTSSNPEHQGMYSYVFDDDYMRHRQQEGRPIDKDVVAKRRLEFINGFSNFFHEDITKTELPIRDVYLGTVNDIALTQSRFFDDNESGEGSYRDVPVAACIKLAAESDQVGKLKNVFGEHNINVDKWKGDFEKTITTQKNRKPSPEERRMHTRKQKLKRRMEGAKDIITHAIESTEEGLFRKADVDKEVEKIKHLYQVN